MDQRHGGQAATFLKGLEEVENQALKMATQEILAWSPMTYIERIHKKTTPFTVVEKCSEAGGSIFFSLFIIISIMK